MADDGGNRIEVDGEPGPPSGSRRVTWIALGVGAVAVVVALVWLPSLIDEPEATSTASTPPVPSTTSTTAATTTTTAPEVGPFVPDPAFTGLGLLTWSKATTEVHPNGAIQRDPVAGVYFAMNEGFGQLVSVDGLAWEGRPSDQSGPGSVLGDWGFFYEDVESLSIAENGEWRPVLDEPPQPEGITGLTWSMGIGSPAQSQDRVVIPVIVQSRIPWEEVFPCPLPGTCAVPFATWSPSPNLIDIHDGGNDEVLASVRMSRHGAAVRFSEGDEVLWTVEFPDAAAAASYVDDYRADSPGTDIEQGVFVGPDLDHLAYHRLPYDYYSTVLVNDDGLFLRYPVIFEPGEGEQPPPLLTSVDGITWEPGPVPEFARNLLLWFEVQRVGSHFYARVERDAAGARERWESDDGVTWRVSTDDLPTQAFFSEADFGYVAVAWEGSFPGLWVSPDGEHWEEVPAPRPQAGYRGDFIDAGVAGDIVYMTTSTENGGTDLWVGRFQ